MVGNNGATALADNVGVGDILAIADFSAAQGDVLKIDNALQTQMKSSTDGSGGTLLTFGTNAGSIDLQGVKTLPSNGVQWV